MNTIFDLQNAVESARRLNQPAFGVQYFSASNPRNRHYVVLCSQAELDRLKDFHREYDYVFSIAFPY